MIVTVNREIPAHRVCDRFWHGTGFTVADLAAKVHTMTGQTDTYYTTRQAAYDLRKLRGKHLVDKPGHTRRYHIPDLAARTIAALLTLRDYIIGLILTGVRSPRHGRKPTHWTAIDRDYETLRIGMQNRFHDPPSPPVLHRQHFVDGVPASR